MVDEITKKWIETFVIDLNLCPFAKAEIQNNRLRYSVSDAKSEKELLSALQEEFELLDIDPSIETTLLIHQNVLQDFHEFNAFLGIAEHLLIEMGLEGVYQIASFHPNYQFSGTEVDDAQNFTNRSPFPMLHILRESSVERAVASYQFTDKISLQNIELMDSLGKQKIQEILKNCFIE